MKVRFLKGINAILALLLGALGFSCVEPRLEYGTPNADIEVSGTITDQDEKPLPNIRVRVKSNRGNQILPNAYSDENGSYTAADPYAFPENPLNIVVEDTTGVYAADSVLLTVKYDRSSVSKGDNWNSGKVRAEQDFQLKKKQ